MGSILVGELIAVHTVSIAGIEVLVRKLGILVGASVGLVTVVAFCGLCAVSLAGSVVIGYVISKAVSAGRNDLLSKKHLAADGALLTVGQTGLGTSRRLAGDSLFAVIGAKVRITNVTYEVLRILIGVTVCGDLGLRSKNLSAY